MAVLGPIVLPEQDEETVGRSALRKASLRLLPLIAVGYGIAYMDRVNVSFAALQMNHDLHFSASVYGFGAGLFFLSYAACEVPSNLLLVRFGARRWLARIMFTWGLLSMGMLLVKTPISFMRCVLLLGIAEAGFFPGIIYYLSRWFPARQRSRAISRFYISLPLSSVVMGWLAGLLLGLQGRWGLAGWQWLFLLEGLPAVALSLVFLLWLPDGPETAAWLNAERAQLADCISRPATMRPPAPRTVAAKFAMRSARFVCGCWGSSCFASISEITATPSLPPPWFKGPPASTRLA